MVLLASDMLMQDLSCHFIVLQVVVAVAGIMLFREPTSFQNLLSISMGLAAGIVFVLAKQGNK